MISLSYQRRIGVAFLCLLVVIHPLDRVAQAASDQELVEMFEGIEERVDAHGAHESESDEIDLNSSPVDMLEVHPKRKFSGWGSYTREFRNICSALAEDGRDLQLKRITDRYLVREDNCPGCYPLMKMLSRTCAPKKVPAIKKSKKKSQVDAQEQESEDSLSPAVAPTPHVIVMQREPGLKMERYLEELLGRIVDDKARRDEGMVALKKLSERLVSEDSQQPPGERDYFSAIQSKFDQFLEEQDSSRKRDQARAESDTGIHVGGPSQESVDELFDYN